MALHTWLGRAIIDPTHHEKLEREASEHEFGPVKLDRHAAEEAAYKNYKNRQHSEAVAHHLAGMRAAISQGKPSEGELHNSMYNLHMKALGLKPGSMPPATSEGKKSFSSIEKYTPHSADQLLLSGNLEKSDREDFYRSSKETESVYLSEPDSSMELSKALRSPMSLDQLNGKKVKVYFNLRNRKFSIMHDGAVVAHVPEVSLQDVRFNVHQAGKGKSVSDKRNNVHAFLEGTFNNQVEHELLPQGIKYNPYKYNSFVRSHDDSPIQMAKAAVLKNLPHPIITVQEEPVQNTEPSWHFK